MYHLIYETKAMQSEAYYVASVKVDCERLTLLRPLDWNDWAVRYDIGNNPYTPAFILEVLSRDADGDVRCVVAENPNTPVYTLIELSYDVDWAVRFSVIFNVNIPFTLLEDLSKDVAWQVREQAKKRIENVS